MRDLEGVAGRLRASTVRVQRRRSGGGSGIIWRSTGLIVTNAHVVPSAKTRITFADGNVLAGTIRSRDFERDLAVVQVDAHDLPAVELGDSDKVAIGQLVLAIGNLPHIAGAARIGIVHAFGQRDSAFRRRWIEADVDLPPGYSGGPLCDVAGRIVGVNSMVGRDGRAFAVPSNIAEAFLSNLQGGARS
jgi:serine protease Do